MHRKLVVATVIAAAFGIVSLQAFSARTDRGERTGQGPAMEATATGSGPRAAVVIDIASAHGIQHYRVSSKGGQMRVARIARDPAE